MKTEITRNEYLQLVGLKTLATKYHQWMRNIVESVLAITGEDDEMGHSGDFVWSDDIDTDALLKKLKITVQESANAN